MGLFGEKCGIFSSFYDLWRWFLYGTFRSLGFPSTLTTRQQIKPVYKMTTNRLKTEKERTVGASRRADIYLM
jgi:hypothetical protein